MFDKIEYTIIPRAQNQFANALATLASMVEIPKDVQTCPLVIEKIYQVIHQEKEDLFVMVMKKDEIPWYQDILKFLEVGIYLEKVGKKERCSVRKMEMEL